MRGVEETDLLELLTYDERAQWRILGERRNSADQALKNVKHDRKIIAERMFRRFLSQGTWHATHTDDRKSRRNEFTMKPADGRADAAMAALLAEALDLFITDSFEVFSPDGSVAIRCDIADMCLHLTVRLEDEPEKVESDLRRMEIDLDIRGWARRRLQGFVLDAEGEIAAFTEDRERYLAQLAKLG